MNISLERISKRFGDIDAVNCVDLKLETGITGLIGANGAGKSTLMRIMAGYLPTTTGTVRFEGKDINHNYMDYANRLGYLPQRFGYNQDFSVEDYLSYISILKGMTKNAFRENADKMVNLLSLGNVMKRKISELSGGMQRRVGLAQAMINDPAVLILDEPTTGLDPEEQIVFRNYISDISRDKIIVISSHTVSDIEQIADKNAIMKSGKIIEHGDTVNMLDLVKGKVFSTIITREEMGKEKNICIISTKSISKESIQIRYYSNEPCFTNSVAEEARLEDVYMWRYYKEERTSQDD